ncbi:hypothetical protein I5Q34_21930 [Streptomyces sp. AV19]|uniref:hypothetical protein n=1 Tax=Streptomyces sp. AV19 TaxID=2793068 RepID=UPI0018FE9F9D|nr:hypothetical protein [Streptomyces sp. AV19]MBH1936895.1 hypothetical protein [Streptomyces sp. AV19]MDG4532936.1 hypothetical protein [Streptomyces sp. AV19]
MTYRTGALVMDTRNDKLGEVMEECASVVWLRPPGGGREWECPRRNLRLADHQELAAAGRQA